MFSGFSFDLVFVHLSEVSLEKVIWVYKMVFVLCVSKVEKDFYMIDMECVYFYRQR